MAFVENLSLTKKDTVREREKKQYGKVKSSTSARESAPSDDSHVTDWSNEDSINQKLTKLLERSILETWEFVCVKESW